MSSIQWLQPKLTSVQSDEKIKVRYTRYAFGEVGRTQAHSTNFLTDMLYRNAVCLLQSPSLENFLQIQAMRQLQILQLL